MVRPPQRGVDWVPYTLDRTFKGEIASIEAEAVRIERLIAEKLKEERNEET